MLANRLDEINEELLNQVCSEQWDESPTLEFKAVLPQPAPDDKPKQEFLKDVTALANAGGGDIVYGIAEINGKANARLPISESTHPADATQRRMGQWLESGVEPRIGGLDMYPVRLASGDYILVIRVPASFQRPHRSKVGAYWQWPVRSGTHTADLTYSQLRDAFDRGATLGERARRFRDERLTSVIAGTTGRPLRAGPRCVVHLLPIEDLSTVQLDAVAKPMLDTLWQAFDLEACGFYDHLGNWVRQ